MKAAHDAVRAPDDQHRGAADCDFPDKKVAGVRNFLDTTDIEPAATKDTVALKGEVFFRYVGLGAQWSRAEFGIFFCPRFAARDCTHWYT